MIMAQLPAKQDQYVKYAEKDSKGRNIANSFDKLGNDVEHLLDGVPMENIVDADGHKRFKTLEISSTEIVQNKFASAVLCGNILKIILRGTVATGQTIPNLTKLLQISKDALGWIYDKIQVNTAVGANFVMTSEITIYSVTEANKYPANLQKTSTELFIENPSNITVTGTAFRGFNLEMTLIID